MTSNTPGPDGGRDLPEEGHPSGQQHYGHPYGRAPQGAGKTLGSVYRFILVWLTMALILWFGSRMFGFERGDVVVAVVSLVVSLAAAIGFTAWLRMRGR
ncbi:hypothetical protein [Microbacterium sp. A93]|uniref:hypothetical protein n=1 Tax=Microbacterium sp. A93 TaxID=3450716 RepID=UPI003F427F30